MWRTSNVNNRIQKVKARLLEYGYIDNEWLTKYLEILEANLSTAKSCGSTQSHHAIPLINYWTSDDPYDRRETLKLARRDNDNFEVNLLYKDHLLIHSYLTLCTDLDRDQRRYEAQADLRKSNSQKAFAIAIERGTSVLSPYYSPNKAKQTNKSKTAEYLKQFYSAEDTEELLNL